MKSHKILLALLACVATSEVARAIPELELFETGVGVMPLASTGTGGQINFGGYTVNISTLDSSTATVPVLNVDSITVSGTPAHPLEILFGEVGFNFNGKVTVSEALNTLSGSLAATTAAYGGTSDNYFDTSQLLASIGPLTGSSTASATGGNLSSANAPFSLTEVVTISVPTGSAGGTLSLDSSLTSASVPDGGSTAALLGAAFVGLVALHRKVRNSKATA